MKLKIGMLLAASMVMMSSCTSAEFGQSLGLAGAFVGGYNGDAALTSSAVSLYAKSSGLSDADTARLQSQAAATASTGASASRYNTGTVAASASKYNTGAAGSNKSICDQLWNNAQAAKRNRDNLSSSSGSSLGQASGYSGQSGAQNDAYNMYINAYNAKCR